MKKYLLLLLLTGCLYVSPSKDKKVRMDAMLFHIDSIANVIDTVYIVRSE